MKDEILSNLDNPGQLERLYRADKSTFKREFKTLYPELKGNIMAGFWNERLNFANEEISWGSNKELLFVFSLALVAGLLAKIPAIFSLDQEFFYTRNIGFIIFPALSAYFAWKNGLSVGKMILIGAIMIVSLIFINLLPDVRLSDTLNLSCVHLALFLWGILGFTFVGGRGDSTVKRLGYLKYNGDLVVMTALFLIAGGIMTGVTLGLFELIGLHIQRFYRDYVIIFGLPAVPIVGTYLTQTNPQLVGKVSPVIAKIFSPLVLVMLVIYLAAIVYSGKDPYNDREFLMILNALLVGVMAIIFFSVTETNSGAKNRIEIWILLILSVLTVMVNGIALSAILFRISEWGFTPNRSAVLGGNLLILINLILVTLQLFGVVFKKKDISGVGKAIASYLPIYILWTIFVTFVFPLIFGFK